MKKICRIKIFWKIKNNNVVNYYIEDNIIIWNIQNS